MQFCIILISSEQIGIIFENTHGNIKYSRALVHNVSPEKSLGTNSKFVQLLFQICLESVPSMLKFKRCSHSVPILFKLCSASREAREARHTQFRFCSNIIQVGSQFVYILFILLVAAKLCSTVVRFEYLMLVQVNSIAVLYCKTRSSLFAIMALSLLVLVRWLHLLRNMLQVPNNNLAFIYSTPQVNGEFLWLLESWTFNK